jgi:hypothetical protein
LNHHFGDLLALFEDSATDELHGGTDHGVGVYRIPILIEGSEDLVEIRQRYMFLGKSEKDSSLEILEEWLRRQIVDVEKEPESNQNQRLLSRPAIIILDVPRIHGESEFFLET